MIAGRFNPDKEDSSNDLFLKIEYWQATRATDENTPKYQVSLTT